MVHIIKADRYSVTPGILEVGTRGSYGNDYIRLALSSEWDGLIPKISFYPLRMKPIAVVFGNDSDKLIPNEVYRDSGDVLAVISGETVGRAMITLPFMLKVQDTRTPANTPPSSPTPSEVEQVYNYMQRALETAQSVRSDANNGVFDGDDGYSPTVEVKEIPGGYRVIITDKSGPHEFDILSQGFIIGSGLHLNTDTNTLSVDTTDTPAETDSRPITSQGVYNEFAVINALLKTI